ncbi:hypothetical protein [Methylobacterium sp. Leaf111]|uniref:hypothetical protein n=1 Tax=Methylobacterium sp. Leaf111 TaxID=1736257 RepID=UPI0012E812A0|nr:hypothetical protein [Methylobacterium sp. Leaf111]
MILFVLIRAYLEWNFQQIRIRATDDKTNIPIMSWSRKNDRFPVTLAGPELSILKPPNLCRENMTGFLLQIKRA